MPAEWASAVTAPIKAARSASNVCRAAAKATLSAATAVDADSAAVQSVAICCLATSWAALLAAMVAVDKAAARFHHYNFNLALSADVSFSTPCTSPPASMPLAEGVIDIFGGA